MFCAWFELQRRNLHIDQLVQQRQHDVGLEFGPETLRIQGIILGLWWRSLVISRLERQNAESWFTARCELYSTLNVVAVLRAWHGLLTIGAAAQLHASAG